MNFEYQNKSRKCHFWAIFGPNSAEIMRDVNYMGNQMIGNFFSGHFESKFAKIGHKIMILWLKMWFFAFLAQKSRKIAKMSSGNAFKSGQQLISEGPDPKECKKSVDFE